MPALSDVQDYIEGSGPDDWIPFSDQGVWTCKDEVSIRIEQQAQLNPNLQEPWAQQLQAPSQSHAYLVYYDSSPVEYHVIAGVDNFRAYIPVPQQPQGPNQPYTITPYQANLGRIITNDVQTFDAYLNRTGIEIRE